MRFSCAVVISYSCFGCGPEATTGIGSTDVLSSSGSVDSLPTTGAGASTGTGTGTSTGGPITSTFDSTSVEADFPVENDCDPFSQNCPENQKCVPYAKQGASGWDGTKCVEVTGDRGPGDTCMTPEGPLAGVDDCALGSICWNVDEDNLGICYAQCSGSDRNPMCPPQHKCVVTAGNYVDLCYRSCDPLSDDCPPDDVCVPSASAFFCVSSGLGEPAQVNEICEGPVSCAKGLVCLTAETASSVCDDQAPGCCQPFCQLPDGLCPNPDQQCHPWYDPMSDVPMGYEDVGVCAVTK